MKKNSKNPILPLNNFVPDVEARVFNNRIYLYGSYDIMDNVKFYCSYEQHVFSSADGVNFIDHGVCFRSEDIPWTDELLFAPDCIQKGDTYYMYFCTRDRTIGVATSKNPEGPFENPVKLDVYGIDPGVFIDDDGEAYIYWGQGDDVCAGKLSEDMLSVQADTVIHPLTIKEHHFHEGSSMRKRNGIYYYVFADGCRDRRPSSLGYATSDSPLGKFTYRGVIIDNFGCDPETWNNHGSMCEIDGEWYIFYHRSTAKSRFSRRCCVEKIIFDENGLIPEIKMSSAGFSDKMLITGENILSYASCLSEHSAYMRKEGVEVIEILGDSNIEFHKIDVENISKLKISFYGEFTATIIINDISVEITGGMESVEIPVKSSNETLNIEISNFTGSELNISSILP